MKNKILTYYIILFSPLLLDYGHVFFWDYKHESGICNIPFTLPFTVKQIMTKDKHDTLKNRWRFKIKSHSPLLGSIILTSSKEVLS